MQSRRLVRSQTDKMIAGVCGGLSSYLNIDSTLIRLFFVLLLFAEGIGAIVYLVLWIVLPKEDWVGGESSDDARTGVEEVEERAQLIGEEFRLTLQKSGDQVALIFGSILVVLGAVFMLKEISPALFSMIRKFYWPALLILGGLVLVLRYPKEG